MDARAKTSNPQKYYMKRLCDGMYYLGFGNCWYEPREESKFSKRIYIIWAAISNFYTFSIILDEFLAHCRSDLTDKELSDLVQFTLAHTSISGKIIFAYIYKKDIIAVLERLLERKTAFVCNDLDQACVKRFATLCIVLVGVSYTTLTASTVDGIRAYIVEGIPIRTEVTYYPTSSDSGLFVNILRFLTIFHWWYIVAIMAVVDCICIGSLVITGYKFKVIQAYFESLREKVLEGIKTKTKKEVEEQFREDVVTGIRMHGDALWCAKNVQSALGNLYSVQVFEGVALLVMCLLKLVFVRSQIHIKHVLNLGDLEVVQTVLCAPISEPAKMIYYMSVERNLIFLLANFAFIASLVVITGSYMLAGGDITHEAALVSTSVFHAGWDLVGFRGNRPLAILALQRSQVPVEMFAFGILILSYSNFISVIRSSYSFFAVMY